MSITGAESVVRTLAAGGVEVCFSNPGTSEMHLVAAFDAVPELRPVLCLFEGVASGAADGYARMRDAPAATLLHTGPGLANGLTNFHNARKAGTPVVNLVGDHATHHRKYDAPLTADVEGFARPVSGWVRTAASAESAARDAADALQAARRPPGCVATLILPADCAWGDGSGPVAVAPPAAWTTPDPEAVAGAAHALRSGEPAVVLLSGRALREPGLRAAQRIVAASGARLRCATFNARVERGAGRPSIAALPYFAERAVEDLAGARHLILVGAAPPVAFFGYPDRPSWLTPAGCQIHELAGPSHDAEAALDALVSELGAPAAVEPAVEGRVDALPRGPLTPEAVHLALAKLMPEGAIVSDEAISGGFGMLPLTAAAPPHDWLQLMGGAIGQGMPLATGAALACPDRPVISLEADGSAMYTLQALWTQAREALDVTTVVFANRAYAILEVELARVGATPGPRARSQYELCQPELDFVALARGHGVPASRADTAEAFCRQLATALAEPGPHLIEAWIESKG